MEKISDKKTINKSYFLKKTSQIGMSYEVISLLKAGDRLKGSLSKKGDQWYFILDVGYDEDGKRKQKWFKGDTTEKKTQKMMFAKIAEIQNGNYQEPSRQLYRHYFDEWLQNKQRDLMESTYKTYKIYAKHIKKHLGNRPIDHITTIHIENMINELSEKLSNASVKKIYAVVDQSLRKAAYVGLIRQNPCDRITPPRIKRTEMKYWVVDDINRFLFLAKKDPLWIVFYLAIKTGMRRGEILNLKWDDINGNTITVRQSKTSSGVRTIAISDFDLNELRKHQEKQKQEKKKFSAYQDNGLVNCTKFGTPLIGRNVLRSFNRIIESGDLKKIRFHDLRHSHATMMLLAGVHAKVISERLGHSSIKITLDTYSHVLPNMQNEAVSMLEKLLGNS